MKCHFCSTDLVFREEEEIDNDDFDLEITLDCPECDACFLCYKPSGETE